MLEIQLHFLCHPPGHIRNAPMSFRYMQSTPVSFVLGLSCDAPLKKPKGLDFSISMSWMCLCLFFFFARPQVLYKPLELCRSPSQVRKSYLERMMDS